MGAHRGSLRAANDTALIGPALPALIDPVLLPTSTLTCVRTCAVDVMDFYAHSVILLTCCRLMRQPVPIAALCLRW